jgi:type IV fimbrial biogenesis protein FimT
MGLKDLPEPALKISVGNNMKRNLSPALKQQGFTLIELMMTITIAIILLSLAVPSFKSFIDSQKLQTTALEFYSAVNMTRAEAIKRGAQVTIAANDGSSWTSGWTVFVDQNNNARPEPKETIVMTRDELAKGIEVSSTMSDNALPYLSYTGNGRGRTNANSQSPQAGTVSFQLGTAIRRVKVNFLGRVRICNPATDLNTCDNNVSGN